MTLPRSRGYGACILELTTRRHRGQLCLDSRAKASTFRMSFCGAPLLVCDTAEVVLSFSTKSSTEFDSTSLHTWYHIQHIRTGVPHIVRSTHACPRTVSAMRAYCTAVLRIEYCCFHLNFGTLDPDIVHQNRKRSLLSQVNGSRRACSRNRTKC